MFGWRQRLGGDDQVAQWQGSSGVHTCGVLTVTGTRCRVALGAKRWQHRATALVPFVEIMLRVRRDALQSVLLVAAILAGLVIIRWWVTGGLDRPMVPPGSSRAMPDSVAQKRQTMSAPVGTRLSLGGREPIVISAATGAVSQITADPDDQTVLFRQGAYTVRIANGRAWAVPAGQASPRRLLGAATVVLPSLADDRVWLVTAHFGVPTRWYRLVEVSLADGRVRTRWALPLRAAPVAVLPSGVLIRTVDDDLQVVAPGSGRVRARLAPAATFIDARGDRVAWLAGGDLHVRNLQSGVDLVMAPPDGSAGWDALGGPVRRAGCCYGLGAFAPDGRTLAIYARVAGPGTPGLAVVDLARGRAALLPGSEGATPDGRLPCLAWASNGWLYFFASGPAVTSIGAWHPGDEAAGLLRLDVDQAIDIVPTTLAAN